MPLLLISLDAVSCHDADRLCGLPALSSLTRGGAFCRHVRPVCPALTAPAHVSLITGCLPDRHGVTHDQPCQPDTPPFLRKMYWDADAIPCPTLWDAARQKGLTAAALLWPVSGKSPSLTWNYPPVFPQAGESALLKLCRHSSPKWIIPTELRFRRYRKSFSQPDLDDFAVLLAESLYTSKKPPDILSVCLTDAADARQRHGTNSPEADAALERLDTRIGVLLEAGRQAFGDALTVCVVSSCALTDVHIPFPLDIALHTACGAHAQSFGKGAYIFTDDPERARKTLEENSARWGIKRILNEEELHDLHISGVPLAVEAAAGVNYVEGGDLYEAERSLCPDDTLMWLKGSGVVPGKECPGFSLIDVAPTLAQLLGLDMPSSEGKSRLSELCR